MESRCDRNWNHLHTNNSTIIKKRSSSEIATVIDWKIVEAQNLHCTGFPAHWLTKVCMWSKKKFLTYRISSYSFRGNYSFLNLEIQRSQYIRPNVTVHKGAETIQGRKLFKGGNYMRKYGMQIFLLHTLRFLLMC